MTISFLQKINSNGGPRNFQLKFVNWLTNNNIKHNFCDNFFEKKKIIIVNAGTKKIFYLIFQKILGAKIIQRLDGLNDLNEIKNNKIKFKAFLSNISMNLIRKNLADRIKGMKNKEKTREQKIAERVAYMSQSQTNSDNLN